MITTIQPTTSPDKMRFCVLDWVMRRSLVYKLELGALSSSRANIFIKLSINLIEYLIYDLAAVCHFAKKPKFRVLTADG